MRIIFNNLQSRAKCTQEERSLIKNGRREGEGDSIFFLRLLIASAIASPRRSSYFLQPSSGFFPPSPPPYPSRYRSFIQLGDTEFALAHSTPFPPSRRHKTLATATPFVIVYMQLRPKLPLIQVHFLKLRSLSVFLGVCILKTFSILSHDDERESSYFVKN